MAAPERLVDIDRELTPTREDVRDVFTAVVIEVGSGTISVIVPWLDGGSYIYGPLPARGTFAAGDEVTIARDQYDDWKVLTVGDLTSTILADDKTYHHVQSTAATVWTIVHNLSKQPAVQAFNSAGDQIIGEIEFVDPNQVRLTFSAANGGDAYCN